MFKLVTWNIQSGHSPDGKTDLGRIIACLDRFCSFDMLWVREVSWGCTAAGEDQFTMLRERLPRHKDFSAVSLAERVQRVRVDASEHGSDHQALLVELDWGD